MVSFSVVQEGERAAGSIEYANGATQKRPSVNGSIIVCGVEHERPGPNTGVEAGSRVTPESRKL